MARKLYRCMGAGCTSSLVVFDTMSQLEDHWKMEHGIDYTMIDIDAVSEWRKQNNT